MSELDAERARTSFDVSEMMYLLAGGKEKAARRRELQNMIASDPVFYKDQHLSRHDFFQRSLEKAKRYFEIKQELKLNQDETRWVKAAIDQELPTDLHDGMFIFTIEGQATDEQKAKWLPLARSNRIIGCYAQTELGHGSNVRGLETTATYDPKTQEFVMHSPTLTATKWWPGGLGKTANHAMVFARLITRGKDHGIHPFIVQIRRYVC